MHDTAKYAIKYLLFTMLSCIFIVAGAYFYKLTKAQTIVHKIEYAEKSSIDYKVFLKDNKFFDEKYLTKENIVNKQQLLVAELIDKISINYNYVLSFSDKVNGKYSYFIKAIIESNESAGSKNYWSKEYVLTEKKTKDIQNSDSVVVLESTDVKYEDYNKILNAWRELANVSMDGKLKVVLVFESTIGHPTLEQKYQINNSDIKLELPLSKAATEITINENSSDTTKTIEEKEKSDDSKYMKYRIGVVFSFIIAVIFLILIVITRNNQKNENKYYVELKRILSTYDGIIVNVSSLPDLDKFNVIKVKSFDELLDAHSEVRLPINYYRQKGKSTFILVNDTMLWMYVLRNVD